MMMTGDTPRQQRFAAGLIEHVAARELWTLEHEHSRSSGMMVTAAAPY
jgi:hypothetical protein